jgi:UDP-N-acetylmuramoylalanine--D-glutamate ligase
LLGLPLTTIRNGLRAFRGVPQRFEVVRRYKGRTFINSTTATNPISAIAALQSVAGKCIVIAGGSHKNISMQFFGQALQDKQVRVVLLAGTATDNLKVYFYQKTPVVHSMQAAVHTAWRMSQPGDTILLAPGAASFGMFRNEFDRGEQFIRSVQTLR